MSESDTRFLDPRKRGAPEREESTLDLSAVEGSFNAEPPEGGGRNSSRGPGRRRVSPSHSPRQLALVSFPRRSSSTASRFPPKFAPRGVVR